MAVDTAFGERFHYWICWRDLNNASIPSFSRSLLAGKCVLSINASSGLVARPAHNAARCGAGVFTVFQYLHAIDEHLLHPGGELVWLLKSGMVGDSGGVEHHHV